MHTIRKLTEDEWNVGSFSPDGTFYSIAAFVFIGDAEAYCSWLNGGTKPKR